jgi:hypothetical protein
LINKKFERLIFFAVGIGIVLDVHKNIEALGNCAQEYPEKKAEQSKKGE